MEGKLTLQKQIIYLDIKGKVAPVLN